MGRCVWVRGCVCVGVRGGDYPAGLVPAMVVGVCGCVRAVCVCACCRLPGFSFSSSGYGRRGVCVWCACVCPCCRFLFNF